MKRVLSLLPRLAVDHVRSRLSRTRHPERTTAATKGVLNVALRANATGASGLRALSPARVQSPHGETQEVGARGWANASTVHGLQERAVPKSP